MKIKIFILFFFLVIIKQNLFCQEGNPKPFEYPKIIGYFSAMQPLINFNKNGGSFNFTDNYLICFPTGINIIKSDKIGISFEVTPFIKAENNDSKISNFLFHPGIIFRKKNGIAITTRAAFETSGRYGGTLIFSKIIIKNQNSNIFLAIPIGFRFGNQMPASVGLGFQCGVLF